MPTNPTQQWIPPDIQAQMLEQQKKQLMAQAMLGAVQPTQPQMVGGRYIGGGLLGAATPMAKALIGAKQGEQQLQSQAEMIRAMAGKWGAGNPAELYKSGKYTPESVTEYAQSGIAQNLNLISMIQLVSILATLVKTQYQGLNGLKSGIVMVSLEINQLADRALMLILARML